MATQALGAGIQPVQFERRQLMALMAALVLQFILGVSLATVINYSPTKHGVAQSFFLVVHIVVAVALLLGAVFRLFVAVMHRRLQLPSALGLTGIVAAMVSGGIAASNGSNIAVLIMALGFILAFMSYGYSIGQLANQK